MREFEIRVFPTLDDLSREAAEMFAEVACRRVEEAQSFSAALSGGSTPRRLYELLGSPPYADLIPWKDCPLFQVDERCVPPDHSESNYRMIREALLDRVPAARASFHRMAGENRSPQDAACEYAAELGEVLRPREGEFPRLDLITLGMGADGHTASLFPESPALRERELWVRENFVEKLGKHRLTLTFPVLNSAAEIVFLVSGAGKAETLERVLEGPLQPELLPAQNVQPAHGRVSWYVDATAASALGKGVRRAG